MVHARLPARWAKPQPSAAIRVPTLNSDMARVNTARVGRRSITQPVTGITVASALATVLQPLVAGVADRKIRLLNQNGREINLPESRIIVASRTAHPQDTSREELTAALLHRAGRRAALAEAIALDELWEIASEETADEFAVDFLAELQFGAAVDDDQTAAFLRAVFADPLYFKFRNGRIAVHSAEQVEQLQTQRRREAEKAERAEKAEKKPARRDGKIERRMNVLERDIAKLEQQLDALDAQMEENASDYVRLGELEEQKNALQAQMDALYEEWEQLDSSLG